MKEWPSGHGRARAPGRLARAARQKTGVDSTGQGTRGCCRQRVAGTLSSQGTSFAGPGGLGRSAGSAPHEDPWGTASEIDVPVLGQGQGGHLLHAVLVQLHARGQLGGAAAAQRATVGPGQGALRRVGERGTGVLSVEGKPT